MKPSCPLAILFSLAIPAGAVAGTYGGGGLVLHQANLRDDVPGAPAPAELGCVGGMGYFVRNGTRWGGEGHACQAPGGAMAVGGGQFGTQSKLGFLYTGAYTTLGGGSLHVEQSGAVQDSSFLFVRPTLTVGVPMGIGAVEASLFWTWPVLQVYHGVIDTPPRRSNIGRAGLQVSFLVGDFSRKRHRRPKPEPRPVVASTPEPVPMAVPVEVVEYAPVPPPAVVPQVDNRPLALPYPAPPPPLE